jgi:hypothetical protein
MPEDPSNPEPLAANSTATAPVRYTFMLRIRINWYIWISTAIYNLYIYFTNCIANTICIFAWSVTNTSGILLNLTVVDDRTFTRRANHHAREHAMLWQLDLRVTVNPMILCWSCIDDFPSSSYSLSLTIYYN